ncbi:hypothetical protein H2248_003022 [Termitomyces sp. 'cryptogamus']|nr:hypothetical protein H2248_003022 [Termitomyces sp. 'cryptogamus']
MFDKKPIHHNERPSKATTSPAIIKKTLGIWKLFTLEEPVSTLQGLLLIQWHKYTSMIPHVFRLLWDVYHLNPSLVFLYLASRMWKGIEPGVNVYVSSQLYVQLESYIRGSGNPILVVQAMTSHLLCVILSSLSSNVNNRLIPKLSSQTELFFEEHLLRERLRFDVYTLNSLKTSRPHSFMGWHCFSQVIEAAVGILGLFTIVTSILFQNHGGTVFTTLCLFYPVVAIIARFQWSQAMIFVAENIDYIRLKALADFGGHSNYREDIVNNNIADHIMKEYKKSRERLGSLFTGNPMVEARSENSVWLQVFRSISGEMPVVRLHFIDITLIRPIRQLYFTFFALLDPSSHSMSALAILHQQSSTLTGSIQTTFRMLTDILYFLEEIKNLYHVESLRLLDGTVNYQPPCDTKGISFELRNVSFTYPGSQSNNGALKNISVKIKAGQLVVVVGANGSGKSTLIKLLTRTYDVTSGEILLDDIPIQTYKMANLRDITSILSQDHLIWPLSLAENVGLGYVACATDEQMINTAMEKGGANDVVARLSQGLATVLDPVDTVKSFGIELPRHQALQDVLDGFELHSDVSGGEKQRLVA